MQETWARSLSQEDSLEKEITTHSSILAWRIPWTEEPGGLHSPWGCSPKKLDATNIFTETEFSVPALPGTRAFFWSTLYTTFVDVETLPESLRGPSLIWRLANLS